MTRDRMLQAFLAAVEKRKPWPAFFKQKRFKRRIYPKREAARSDVFDYIEISCNPIR